MARESLGHEDPELRAEQDYLDRAHQDLSAMRRRAETLLADLRQAGQPDLDYQAALVHRVAVLGESARPLLFGRIDEEGGPSWHIGRRHVEDGRGDPVVVDWRAPISMPFYQARMEKSLGLARRRQVMVDRRRVVAVADDLFRHAAGDLSGTRLRGGDALLAELERARTGEMLDIVATIQVEQDDIIRAPLDLLVAVQGGPGTGKTAVGLHRAAFLLYNHPSLSGDGVLVLGPSRAFLRYIAQVLPSLGEEAVMQTTVADLAPRVKVRAEDSLEVRRLKGDARMAQVLARALWQRRQLLTDEVTVRARFTRCTLGADSVNDLSDSIAATRTPYQAGRLALRARLVSLARQQLRQSGRFEADESWFERELMTSDGFKELLDQLWPSVSPASLVSDVLTSAERLSSWAAGIFSDDEWPLLLRRRGQGLRTQAWAADDLPLLDEADFLVSGRSRTYGHIVVDEAQDLSPMQFRMLARRAPGGSLTVLGDLAQATGPWSYESWDEILRHLPTVARVRRDELTLGYRAPGQVLDLASRLLPEAAPSVQPTHSIRRGRNEPRLMRVDPAALLTASLGEARRLAGLEFLVGLVVAPDHLGAVSALVRDQDDIGLLDTDGMERRITVVAAGAAKGLEFDAVVVVEPALIAGTDRRGLRLLYVAMTRPIQHLSVVHAEPLPKALLP
ncbi:MAG TPA: AAA family ATPase [Acidimicrobiales bacterium]|nr:AAA family ATPase [Acidimicrobiales bacterium]